jgi:radical SAM protein with 4Fe4S-binding SPASM domain
VVIDWNGNVVLCCNDYFSSIKFGNVENEKFIDIWNSDLYTKTRSDLRHKKFNLDICKKV